MNLLRAHFIGVAGVADGTYSFCDPQSGQPLDFVVVTGPPSVGKTRLLETIAAAKETIAPYATAPDPTRFIRAGSGGAKVLLEWDFDDEERAYAGLPEGPVETETIFGARDQAIRLSVAMLLTRYSHGDSRPRFAQPGKLEYFHAARQIDWAAPGRSNEAEQKGLRPFRSTRKYAFVPTFLSSLATTPYRQEFEALLELFSDTCRVDPAAVGRDFPLTSRGERRSTAQLSSSEEQSVLVAATAAALGLDRSLVLVDRPELCGVPGGDERLIYAWRSIGRGAQVIAATDRHQLLAAIPPERLIELSNHGADG